MPNERFEKAVDEANDRIDLMAERAHREGGEPRIPDGDRILIRIFPYFVAFCLVVWLVWLVFFGDGTLAQAIEILCLSFTMFFAVLGVPCALMMGRGAFSGWYLLGIAVLLSLVLWVFELFTGINYFYTAIVDMLYAIGVELEEAAEEVVGFLGTLAVMLFTPIGVTSVISAYLRRYIPSVLAAMSRHARDGTRGKAERFFMVPDIVDVQEVVLEEPAKARRFDLGNMISITTYLFILGLLISSYIFVNPYFLDVMDWKTMLAVTLMLSMFTPALILPWEIFRGLGAKVKSEAHRDYYIWRGAKSRLFSTFLALGVFMMMFLLSVYLGYEVVSILQNYASFLIPLLATSVMYGTVYTNNFEAEDRRVIKERFEEAKCRDAGS